MSTVRAPAVRAARYAASPAVPAPITATSTFIMRFLSNRGQTACPASDQATRSSTRHKWSVPGLVGAESRRLRRLAVLVREVLLEVFRAADEPAADEDLRRGALAGDGTQGRGRDAL